MTTQSLDMLTDEIAPAPLLPRVLAGLVVPATLVLALILSVVPWATNLSRLFIPDVLAPVLFFWCVYQPSYLPLVFVFALGLMADILDASPLGTQATAYMVFALIARSQGSQLVSLGLLFNWGVFALAMLVLVVIHFLISVLATVPIFDQPLLPAALKSLQIFLTTNLAYLGLYLLLGLVNRLLPAPLAQGQVHP